MRIRKRYNDPQPTLYTITGTEIVPVFALNEECNKVVEVGKRNVRKEIDSFADSTDINVILHQLRVGDSSIIERIGAGEFSAKEGQFIDTTFIPDTLEEARKLNQNIRDIYNSIPEEIRNQFNGIDDFVGSSDDKLQSIFDSYNAKISVNTSVITEEKGENE